MLEAVSAQFGWPDIVAPLFLVLCWAGYAAWAEHHPSSLMARVHDYRCRWMRRMLARDPRIIDIQVVQILTSNIAFFSSSAVLIVGGCLAVLGAREEAMAVLQDVPFVVHTPPLLWKLKLGLMILVFVYAFFKFTWAIRQFNYVAIMIGAAPPPAEAETEEAVAFAERAARMATASAANFNNAMRAFYFGLAIMAWFIQPWLFVLLTAYVVLIIWRREFHSEALVLLAPLAD